MISITLESVDRVGVEDEWNFSNDTEFTMHSIHTYPAKFPSFIAKKAFDYAEAEGVKIEKVADIFCGCGTVALEAKTHSKDFWGCDINPVATLIYTYSPNWAQIIWDMLKEDSIESQQEFGNFVTRSLINRIQNYSFDEASIRSDTRPNTAELRKVVEGERYLSYAEQPAQAYTGDLFKNGSKYYLNIRAQCSLAREGDPLLYCIHGEKLKSKDIISEDIRLTTEKELVFSAKQHFSLDQMREICQDTEKLEVFNRNFSRHRNSIFFRKGTILERDDKVIIGCVAGEQAIQFKMDLEILSFNAWKGKRIGRVLPPYITKIQQKCAVNMVREGVAPLPKELFISFED